MFDGPTIWLIIVGMGIITFLLRLSFIVLLSRVRLPALIQRGLNFVPPAVFSALVLPDLVRFDLTQPFTLQTPARLIAGSVAVFVAWRTKNIVITIVTGLATLLILQTLL